MALNINIQQIFSVKFLIGRSIYPWNLVHLRIAPQLECLDPTCACAMLSYALSYRMLSCAPLLVMTKEIHYRRMSVPDVCSVETFIFVIIWLSSSCLSHLFRFAHQMLVWDPGVSRKPGARPDGAHTKPYYSSFRFFFFFATSD